MSTAEFDYVIVGGGSAGCVLANRLSADPSQSVCLVEAGPTDSSPLVHIPLAMPALFEHPMMNWRYTTVPQAGAVNRRIYVPRGKMIGGTSSLNGMVYQRGHPSDYDDWEAAGNPGWAFSDVLPYFRKSEGNTAWKDSPLHGTAGPLTVTDLKTRSGATSRFIAAAEFLGYRRCDDFNGADPEGFGFRQVTQRNGLRMSVAKAYLTPVLHRKNLRVITGVLVDKLVLSGRRATAVRCRLDGAWQLLAARREILLSAGVFGSPQILQRSGVGNGSDLQAVGVAAAHHLPGVGANLQDHAAISLSYNTDHTEPYGISWRVAPRLLWDGLRFVFARQGMISSNVLEGNGFIRTEPGLPRPDVQFSFMPARRNPQRNVGLGHGYAVSTVVLRPFSRGSVRLADPRPESDPLIDLGLLVDERDAQLLLKGFRIARRIMTAPPFADYKGQESSPGASVNDDEALIAFIRANVGTTFHPVGTCAMGQGPQHVVDAQLRVHGLEGLRVVDASIIPTQIGGNTNGPTVMIAEKAADMILTSR